MKIIHEGNAEVINASRCAMDALKYSRVERESLDKKQAHNSLLEKELSDAELKVKPLSEIQLKSGSYLYISKTPHSWFITDTKFNPKLVETGVQNGATKFLYEKGLLEIDGKAKENEELDGRYVVRSDNTSLISLTDKCNLSCGHCVANANQNNLGAELTLNQLEQMFEVIASQKNKFGLDVEKKVFLSGGEPLIRKDLTDIAKKSCGYGLSTHICTNGLKASDDFLKNLRGYPLAFSVSFDGSKESHELIRGKHTYERTIGNIKKIRENGFDLFLNNFLHQGNYGDMEEVVDFALNVGARGVNFIRAIPRGRGKDMQFKRVPDKLLFSKIYEVMQKDNTAYQLLENENTFPILALSAISGVKSLDCGLSRENYFFLDSGGNIFPCPGTRYDEFKIGNINEENPNSLLEQRVTHPLSTLRADEFPTCSPCDYTYFCGGDCRGSAYGNSNPKDIKAPVPYCSERQESLKELFNILSTDPNFMKNKSEIIVQNAREETQLAKKA